MGHALQIGELAHTGLPAVAQIIDQKQQAVDAVLDPRAIERHINSD